MLMGESNDYKQLRMDLYNKFMMARIEKNRSTDTYRMMLLWKSTYTGVGRSNAENTDVHTGLLQHGDGGDEESR